MGNKYFGDEMKRFGIKFAVLAIATAAIAGCTNVEGFFQGAAATKAYGPMNVGKYSAEETMPPFGGPSNVAFAAELWKTLEEKNYAGPQAISTGLYEGISPHGVILEVIESEVSVGDYSGHVFVKRNYGGKDLTEDDVLADPAEYLKSVTVMFKREDGYDSADKNWFWVKYAPDGSVMANPKGMKLAGRVAKGMDAGCIACHTAAPGDDMVYTHDRLASAE